MHRHRHSNVHSWSLRSDGGKECKRELGNSRGDGHCDLTDAMERLSVQSATQIQVPPLPAFELDGINVVSEAVEVGEAVPPAGFIPTNFSSTSAYLNVNRGAVLLPWLCR